MPLLFLFRFFLFFSLHKLTPLRYDFCPVLDILATKGVKCNLKELDDVLMRDVGGKIKSDGRYLTDISLTGYNSGPRAEWKRLQICDRSIVLLSVLSYIEIAKFKHTTHTHALYTTVRY